MNELSCAHALLCYIFVFSELYVKLFVKLFYVLLHLNCYCAIFVYTRLLVKCGDCLMLRKITYVLTYLLSCYLFSYLPT